jgi:hypothetical protein
MVFFILVVAAVIGIAVYVTKKTRSTNSTIPTTPPTFYPPKEQPSPWNTPDVETTTPPKIEVSDEDTVVVDAPKMSAKPKKKPQPKKKPTTKVNA